MLGTVIQCIRQASLELGLPAPAEASAAREVQAQQMFALFNACGNELTRAYEWEFLRRSAYITLVLGQSTYPLPPDFSKLINQTLWEDSNVYSVIGPVSPRAWAYLTNSVTIAPDYCFIIKDRQFQFTPTPGDNGMGAGKISYEYVGDGWLQDANNPARYISYAENDLDVIQFDFWLMVKFLKLKMWEAKGMDTTTLANDFKRTFSDVTAQDHGAAVLNLSKRNVALPAPTVADTGFGL